MNQSMTFNGANALSENNNINNNIRLLEPEIDNIKQSLEKGYNTCYAALNLTNDKNLIKNIKKKVCKALDLNPDIIFLIGIGGSSLGPEALFRALYGLYYNQQDENPKFYIIDTLDDDLLNNTLCFAEKALKENKNIIVIIITKSGTTSETIANASFFIELLKQYKFQDYFKYVFAITDKGSEFYNVASDNNFNILEIPEKVGGRYSVLSAVGLFPLALLGIDIDALSQGAQDMKIQCLSNDTDKNSAAQSAAIIYSAYSSGKNIHDSFFFSPTLQSLGKWYRQLVGESLGKKYDKKCQLVEVGITPTVSIGTTDLHSVAQLYLGGPRDKITTFINYTFESDRYKVPNNKVAELVPMIIDKSISTIKSAIFKGVVKAYNDDNRPFIIINIPYRNVYALGQFIMMKMIEVIYIGYLLNINPFDQPAVQAYKSNTRKALK